ncbi:MAG: hypothetical protein AAGA12_00735 [Pseudomonadota bacterium]
MTQKIVGYQSEQAALRSTQHLSAWESFHLGVNESRRNTREGDRRAMVHLQRAVALDPDFSSAYAILSDVASSTAFNYYSDDRSTYLERMKAWADIAIEIDPENSLACAAKGRSYWLREEPAEGLHWLDRALQIDPNSAYARYSRGILCGLIGDTEKTEIDLGNAIQSSPLDPKIYSMRGHLALSCLQREEFEIGLE